jgi:hypothetical protein
MIECYNNELISLKKKHFKSLLFRKILIKNLQ